MGSPEPDTSTSMSMSTCGSLSSHSLVVSPEMDSMDWFMNLATPCTPTLDDLGKDLFGLQQTDTGELAKSGPQASHGATTPQEIPPSSEGAWTAAGYSQGVYCPVLDTANIWTSGTESCADFHGFICHLQPQRSGVHCKPPRAHEASKKS